VASLKLHGRGRFLSGAPFFRRGRTFDLGLAMAGVGFFFFFLWKVLDKCLPPGPCGARSRSPFFTSLVFRDPAFPAREASSFRCMAVAAGNFFGQRALNPPAQEPTPLEGGHAADRFPGG